MRNSSKRREIAANSGSMGFPLCPGRLGSPPFSKVTMHRARKKGFQEP